MGKSAHHGTALLAHGRTVFDKPLPNGEPQLRELFARRPVTAARAQRSHCGRSSAACPTLKDAGPVALPRGLTLRGESTALRVSHGHGVPQGSSNGFSPQVPARRVAERDEQAVKVWKEATWAEVKEPGRHAEATSASRTRQASPDGRPKDARGDDAAAHRSSRSVGGARDACQSQD
ncbi:winged helix-turn-helix domain-containing protein [Streptomyces sp. NPDC087859]|uniref:winged helix-turn-helix domain-containing protein n=1 Tax=Streptomyces sp. NPDC087859 TaxID=3365812 RepID=UPI0037F3C8F3